MWHMSSNTIDLKSDQIDSERDSPLSRVNFLLEGMFILAT